MIKSLSPAMTTSETLFHKECIKNIECLYFDYTSSTLQCFIYGFGYSGKPKAGTNSWKVYGFEERSKNCTLKKEIKVDQSFKIAYSPSKTEKLVIESH